MLFAANPYVPWDPTYAENFKAVVSNAIGNGVNVGIVLFGIALSISVIIMIVKRFTRT